MEQLGIRAFVELIDTVFGFGGGFLVYVADAGELGSGEVDDSVGDAPALVAGADQAEVDALAGGDPIITSDG